MMKHQLQFFVALLLASSLAACGGGSGGSLPGPMSTTNASVSSTQSSVTRTVSSLSDVSSTSIAIDAGGAANGNWFADTDFSSVGTGSAVAIVTNAINTTHVSNPAPLSVYQSQRFAAALTYTIPKLTPSGAYTVRLHFVESFFKALHQRIFSVKINGVQVLTNFDIFQTAGGANVAVAEQFSTHADAAGKIGIELISTVNNASIAGVQISAGSGTPATTMAIDVGSSSAQGNWVADTDYQSGGWGGASTSSKATDTSHASNPAPQSVYQTQRWASTLAYTIPKLTPNSAYNVRLHFSESYWNAVGQRVFDITINGAKVLSNFDIFQTAGGMNIAVAKEFASSANATGTISIGLAATVNYASLAGIEIIGGSSTSVPIAPVSPTPIPVPVGGNALPWVYSELWSNSSPLKTTVAQHIANGASIVNHNYMDVLWNEGISNYGTSSNSSYPIYVSKASDPLKTVVCTWYGGGCNASGVQIHIPTWAIVQNATDGHLFQIDPYAPGGGVEVDCWQATISGSTLSCAWAGAYAIGGDGIHEPGSGGGSEGIHFGPAASSYIVTAQELLNGHIDHALGINTECLNSPNVYPADTTTTSDYSGPQGGCDGSSNPPHYGSLVHLKWSASQISSSAYSAPCKTVLTALITYGAYLTDTGNYSSMIDSQNATSYTANPATAGQNPWPGIQSQLNAAGDGNGNSWSSCMNRLQSSDFEMLQIVRR